MGKQHCFVLPTDSDAPKGLLGNLPEVNPDITDFETWSSPGLSKILEYGFIFAACQQLENIENLLSYTKQRKCACIMGIA